MTLEYVKHEKVARIGRNTFCPNIILLIYKTAWFGLSWKKAWIYEIYGGEAVLNVEKFWLVILAFLLLVIDVNSQ